MRSTIRPFIIALLLGPAAALGAESGPAPSGDPVLEAASAAAGRRDWPAAQGILREALSRQAGNPDYHNLYAYALRNAASPDMSLVFKHYNEALRLDPKHRGAHEYIGEAYLMVGNLPKAKEHLAQLDKLCFFPCSEYAELKKAVADYEAKRK